MLTYTVLLLVALLFFGHFYLVVLLQLLMGKALLPTRFDRDSARGVQFRLWSLG